MMRLRADLRSEWRSWTLLSMLIGVVAAVVLLTATGARRTDTAYHRMLEATRAGDLIVAPQGTGLTGYYGALAQLPGVAVVAPLRAIDLFTDDRAHHDVLAESAIDARFGRTVQQPKLVAGRMYDITKPDEAVATHAATLLLHLHAGQVLHMLAAPTGPDGPDTTKLREVTLKIVGIGVSTDDVVPSNSQSSQPTLLTGPAFAAQFDAGYNSFAGAFVRLRPDTSRDVFTRQAQDLAARYPDTMGSVFVSDQHRTADTVERAIRPFAVALASISLLLALVGLVVVGQVAVRRTATSVPDQVVLRDVGMSRRQLLAIPLAEVAASAIVGAVLAVGLAVALSPLTPIGPARLAEVDPGVAVNWAMLGIGAAAIVALLVGWVAWPAWRMSSATRTAKPAQRRASRLAAVVAAWGSPTAAVGVGLTLQPRRGRGSVPVRAAITATVVAIAALAAAVTFGANLVHLVDSPQLYGQTWSTGVDTGFGQVPPTDASAYLGRQPGITGWTFGNHGALRIAGRDVPAIGLAAGKGPIAWPAVVEGRQPTRPDEIVLGVRSMDETHARIGDRVTVSAQGDPTPRTMRVVGRAVFPLFGQGVFTTTGLGVGAAMINPAPASDGFNFFLVDTTGAPLDAARFSARLQQDRICPADQTCEVYNDQRPLDVANYARVQMTPLLLAGLLGLLAVATLTHLSLTTTRRRRHDLALLQTLGFVRRQVAGAVALQAIVLLVVALAVGLPVGIALGRWLWTIFAGHLGTVISAGAPIGPLAAIAIATIGVAVVIAVVPAWLAARRAPALALRTE
jgi:ABC-type antimicrobial peptide transport system permease subunit